MKTRLLYFILFIAGICNAQIELTPNPSDINSGTLTLTYGASGDYSIFDPISDPNLFLYTGLQTDADPLTWDYHDDFANSNTLIPLTYDNNLGYYIATFNPATRDYLEEPSLNTVNIPTGTTVNDWYFLITVADLSRQSADLKGSDYGFSMGTLSVDSFNKIKDVYVSNGEITFNSPGKYSVDVYDILGKQVASKQFSVSNALTHNFQLQNKGVYLVKISDGLNTRTVKMLKY
tara:strand:- start:1689 stop:2387 length:699 start_codon:yes stop_codon:yes gene_type:complete